jgi:hypothetical protein
MKGSLYLPCVRKPHVWGDEGDEVGRSGFVMEPERPLRVASVGAFLVSNMKMKPGWWPGSYAAQQLVRAGPGWKNPRQRDYENPT